MAKIKLHKSDEVIEVKDGSEIREACEDLGVPFGCRNGVCATCMVKIISGAENLSELTREEKILERDKNNRLACQCKIKSGEAEISL